MSRPYLRQPDSQPLGSLGVVLRRPPWHTPAAGSPSPARGRGRRPRRHALSRRTGSSARMHSIASLAWGRSRASGETRRKPSDAVAETACTMTSATPTLSSASRSSSSDGSPLSPTDRLRRAPARRRSPRATFRPRSARSAALQRSARARRGTGGADLLGHGQHPLDELLDPLSRGNRLAALEIEQLAGEPVANCAPEVLLDQPVRQRPHGAPSS